jgi:hypothetical protein
MANGYNPRTHFRMRALLNSLSLAVVRCSAWTWCLEGVSLHIDPSIHLADTEVVTADLIPAMPSRLHFPNSLLQLISRPQLL